MTPNRPYLRALLRPLMPMLVGGIGACATEIDVGTIANDGGSESGASDTGEGGIESDAHATGADVGLDGKEDTLLAGDAGCGVGFVQQGTFKNLEVVTGATPPDGAGGTITPGTYVLVTVRSYIFSGTAEVSETLVITGSPSVGVLERLVEVKNTSGSFSPEPLHGERFNWTANDPSFFFGNPTCSSGGTNRWGAAQYTATPTSLTLLGQGFEHIYMKI